jgi:stage II sporulation protein D
LRHGVLGRLALCLFVALCACGGERIALSSIAPPTIRVLLGTHGDAATLSVPDAWEVVSLSGQAFADRGTNLVRALRPGANGILFGDAATGATTLKFRPVGAFMLEMEGERRAYHGDLIVRLQGARLQFVNELDLERYVAGVIINEMGTSSAPSAYETQAVVARTYGYTKVRAAPDAPYHVFDDTRSQVYKGVTIPKDTGISLAQLDLWTAQTRGVVLTWRGEPFPTYYSSTCGGHTTEAVTSGLDPGSASAVYMGVPCGYCKPSKYFTWAETVPVQKLLDNLKARGVVAPLSRLDWTRAKDGQWVSAVTVTFGPKGATKVVPGPDFRSAAGLRSMRIESVEAKDDGTLVFHGGGWGHGVGMCQVGAQEMARKGFAADQILRYYYPGAEFTRLY